MFVDMNPTSFVNIRGCPFGNGHVKVAIYVYMLITIRIVTTKVANIMAIISDAGAKRTDPNERRVTTGIWPHPQLGNLG